MSNVAKATGIMIGRGLAPGVKTARKWAGAGIQSISSDEFPYVMSDKRRLNIFQRVIVSLANWATKGSREDMKDEVQDKLSYKEVSEPVLYPHKGIRFTVHGAQGGFVVEFMPNHEGKQNYIEPVPNLIVVTDLTELGKVVEQTVVMQALKA